MVKKVVKDREVLNARQKRQLSPIEYEPTRAIRDFDKIFDSFRQDMDRLLWDPWSFPNIAFRSRPLITSIHTPKMNVRDRGDAYTITAELPGINKEHLDITVEENRVTIKAESKTEREEKDENYLLQERGAYSFQRCFELPEDIRSESVDGEMKDGVLHLTLPKKEPRKKKVHKIKLK